MAIYQLNTYELKKIIHLLLKNNFDGAIDRESKTISKNVIAVWY